jgi:hypothetical protein
MINVVAKERLVQLPRPRSDTPLCYIHRKLVVAVLIGVMITGCYSPTTETEAFSVVHRIFGSTARSGSGSSSSSSSKCLQLQYHDCDDIVLRKQDYGDFKYWHYVTTSTGTLFGKRSLYGPRRQHNTILFSSSSQENDGGDVDYTPKEMSEMRDLIISLSLESTDHDRRLRLRDIFHEKLDGGGPNGDDDPQRFCQLFDTILARVGDEVQMDARKRMFEDESTPGATVEPDGDAPGQVATEQSQDTTTDGNDADTLTWKSPEELQLWALVDMMVQSKTIVKKHNGELGSRGAFR